MKCHVCGYPLHADEARASCTGCPLSTTCTMIRCPNCGFEEPAQSTILTTLQRWRTRNER